MVDPKENIDAGAKRRLDLEPKEIVNPYKKDLAKKQKSTESDPVPGTHKEGATAAVGTTAGGSSKTTSIITPETGIEKFFVKDGDGKKKSSAKRKLVSPKSADSSELVEDLYYHSDDSNTQKKKGSGSDYHPDHIHSTVDYHHRGEVSLTTGQQNAYRFIRDHFNIPKDIELDSKFGPWSGICFEERVMRAYTLDELMPKKKGVNSLKVCTYCGEEGHKKGGCMKLI
jgi:hypothetical protein